MNAGPPKRIVRILQWVCPDYLFEGIIGDLEEQYFFDVNERGIHAAKRRFIWHALLFIRPGIIFRNKFKLKIINTAMLRNHLKVGIRSILKSKLYSFINAVGLSIAIAFSVLIYLYIQDENSFDQFHTNKDRIYRVHKVRTNFEPDEDGETVFKSAWLQTGVAPTLKEEAPEVIAATGFNSGGSAIFSVVEKVFNESITFVHPDFFKMFDFQALHGDPQSWLSDPAQVVLSASTAEKYFGDDNPVGKVIQLSIYNDTAPFTVVGVIENAPHNSSLDYGSALVHAKQRPYYEGNIDSWQSWNTPTFVMLEKGANADQLKGSLQNLFDKYVQPAIDEWVSESGYEPRSASEYDVLPLSAIHLTPDVSWTRVSDPKYSLILSGIAILILIIACINYIALAMTSAAGKRIEVGIRKAVGGAKQQLIGQFMTESLLLAMLAMILSVVLIIIFLPYFNEFTNKAISLSNDWWQVGLVMVAFTFILGIIAGIYPAFVLSAYKPLAMMKSRSSSKVKASVTRPLVVLQFAISAFLIICSVVMLRQMNFITTKDLGYNQDQVLVIPTYTGYSDAGEQVVEQFKNEVKAETDIVAVSGVSASFNQGWSRNGFRINGEVHEAFNYRVDPDYIKTLGIKIKAGRDFDDDIVTDHKKALIVNEALVKDMGWDNPLNETLDWREDSTGGWKIIGVAEDYHFLSLENTIEPLFLHLDPEEGKITTMLVKIKSDDMPATLDKIKAKWQNLFQDKPFDYNFLDEDVAQQYESYQKWSKIMWVSTLFAILIACLGLFGLAGINAINRTKEIGIRKALGAEMRDILVMMNKPYIVMAVLSFVLAAPASWWVMQKWLSDFKFAITLGWQLFAVTLIAALLLALITVSYHALKAAMINPADTLKYE